VPTLDPHSVLERVRRDVERNAFRAPNGIRLATGVRPSVGCTPKDVVWRSGRTGFVTDRLTVGGDRVHLADVRCPFLTVLANRDHIVPEPAVAPLIELIGAPDKHELRLDAGTVGLQEEMLQEEMLQEEMDAQRG
jgi:hypothetical protein